MKSASDMLEREQLLGGVSRLVEDWSDFAGYKAVLEGAEACASAEGQCPIVNRRQVLA
jgi:hypothetical protein